MATLYFKVGADYENVIRLRDEIKKLENQLKSFGKSTPETQIRQTEERLATTRQEFVRLTTEAAKAGAVMESDLKRKINSVTKASDELSEEIIKQRKIIRDTQDDVRRLSEQYSKIGKFDPKAISTLNQLNRAKAALNEQKYALGDLQDQQARNRLELRQLTREYRDFSQGTNEATVTVDALMSSLKRTAAEIGGLAAIKKFSSDVVNATGTMQQLHVALSTILQDGDKASTLISEITSLSALDRLSDELSENIDTDTAVVASSDFTHYGPRFGYMPYGRKGLEKAIEKDSEAASLIAGGRTDEVFNAFRTGTICGIAAMMILSETSRKAGLHGWRGMHATSADSTGDDEDFVSYQTIYWR